MTSGAAPGHPTTSSAAFSAAFSAALSATERRQLADAAAQANSTPPADMRIFWLAGNAEQQPLRLGLLQPERAALLAELLPHNEIHETAIHIFGDTHASGLHWHAQHLSPVDRSARLQAALQACHARGLVHGWRDEAFAFWGHDCLMPPEDGRPPLLAVERAGFRFLGMRSHAVHINGFTADGRLWCGRRARTKATDPGQLDNVTAGGLPAGEAPWHCAQRELLEEAGALPADTQALHAHGLIRTARVDAGGWHDETLLVYNWACPAGWTPRNQDGEVAEFLCLTPAQTVSRILEGEFTRDAVASLAQGLGLGTGPGTGGP
ncbi:DUF4743 domain-containing protein [Rhodoferax sp. OV413]|uniref:NUDIX hydrolase n=1 Tax=Rhodoferax sp. OV413 TaxID=1855285 RepID=UPI0025EFADD2|nr:DUF4743 domain-containing protein [Rhodoferax sp. OV413]